MKKFISILITVVILGVFMSGCSSSQPSPSQTNQKSEQGDATKENTELSKPIELKLATESAVGTPGDLSAQDFKKLVEEKTNGQVLISYFPAGQAGTGDDLTELMQSGSVDMSWRAIEWYSKFESGWNILLMGFTFNNQEQVELFMNSEKNQDFKENLLNNSGLRMLSNNGYGAPRVLVSTKPINSPEDMKGLNLRVPGIEMYLKTWEGVGVNCIQVPWGDSYMALSQGAVDALESPLGSIYGMKFHEVGKYITLTNHVYSPYTMVINNNSFNKLTPELQEILVECANEAGDLFTKYDSEQVATKVEEMKESGVEFNETPDLEAFKELLSEVAEECEKKGMWPEGLYDYVINLQ